MNRKLIKSEDGSHTIYLPDMDEYYHSKFGALQESMHIFIKYGLFEVFPKIKHIKILEVGFGTGLNALLTCLETQNHNIMIEYDAIEPFPLEEKLISSLNYTELIKKHSAKDIFTKIHHTEWEKRSKISENFYLHKMKIKLQDAILEDNHYNLVYFDAFGPDVQAEMWTLEIFRKIYHSMKKDSILTTYSAKGSVKRALRASGFVLETLPGPIGKREITKATRV